jgi:hypothetical protein
MIQPIVSGAAKTGNHKVSSQGIVFLGVYLIPNLFLEQIRIALYQMHKNSLIKQPKEVK